ncbi:MAG: hypothetical protein AAGF10_01545 [Verrucomicrobiota bacterium]
MFYATLLWVACAPLYGIIQVGAISGLNTTIAGTRTLEVEAANNSIVLLALTNETSTLPTPTVILDPNGSATPFIKVGEEFTSLSGQTSYSAIYAVSLGDVSASTIEFSITGNVRGYSAIQLGNVPSLDFIVDTSATTGGSTTTTLNDIPAGSFVFSSITNRQQSNTFSSTDFDTIEQAGANRYRQGYAYAENQSGTQDYTWNIANTGSSRPTAVVTVAVIVPEPAHYANLMAAAVLLLVLIRRRRH